MGRLLETRLPNATNGEVDGALFNRLVRILQLNLESFDPNATPVFTVTLRDQNQFNAGDVIWNPSENALEVFHGKKWVNITDSDATGVEATGGVGKLSVVNNGTISITL